MNIKEKIRKGIEVIKQQGGDPIIIVGRNHLARLKNDFDRHMQLAGRPIPPPNAMPMELYQCPIVLNELNPDKCEVVSKE